MTSPSKRLLLVSLLGLVAESSVIAGHDPAVDPHRLADRKAVERVLWNHRLWPESNRAPKPDLSSVLSDDAIAERVGDDARKRAALEKFWSRRLTASDVQAEIDRMAAHTKSPRLLAEMFAALDNDPGRIAAAIAEPALADRLIRSWYASDETFQATVRGRAERAIKRIGPAGNIRDLDGDFLEADYVLREDAARAPVGTPDSAIAVGRGAWDDLLHRLGAAFDAGPVMDDRIATLPRGRTSHLVEEGDAFRVYRILESGTGHIRVASVVWPRRSFESWWREARSGIAMPAAPLAGRYVLPALAGACVQDTWSPMQTESPLGRTKHTAVWTGSEMIVWGGMDAAGPLIAGERYSPATDTWTPTAVDAQTPAARYSHTAIWTGTRMIVWGGATIGSPGVLNSGGSYDPLSDSWTSLRADATTPAARTNHTAIWTGSRMIVWGGAGSDSCNCGYTDTGGLYDPATDTWSPTRADSTAPDARAGHTAVWSGSQMIIYGGYAANGAFHREAANHGLYDPATDAWVTFIASGRSGHSAVWTGNRMVIWGGGTHFWDGIPGHPESISGSQSGLRFDFSAGTSIPTSIVPGLTPSARQGHTAVWTGSRMIIWGGGGGPGGQYDPDTDDWFPVSPTQPAPPQVSGNTAIWTGSEMIVWGGGSDHTNAGGRYDPSTDSWLRTATDYEFPGDVVPQGPAAVWTGSEMLVWAGPAASGRYSPATDSWSAMTATGSPTARVDESYVWTGSEMIVWGGNADTGTPSGGAYNPTTDQWTTTSGPGEPAPRYAHTAVWTGSEMVIWGGSVIGVGLQSTGARYNPASHRWLPTRADGTEPSPRYQHTAVWTGNEMIVWGGSNPSEPSNNGILRTGARYNPGTDSWVPLPFAASNPDALRLHQAVWTGAEMIVWGGEKPPCCLPTSRGWAYSPAANQWRSLPDDGTAPEPRRQHVSVWTGSELLVWGGWQPDTNKIYLNSGGRYSPATDTWTPIVPDQLTLMPRASCAAVSTGEATLIWGGEAGSGQPIKTGAAYCSSSCVPAISYRDTDLDGHGDPGQPLEACGVPPGYSPSADDCSDLDGAVWGAPGEATDLVLTTLEELFWAPPAAPGGSSISYDVVRSTRASDFLNQGSCIASGLSAPAMVDEERPDPGQAFFYLVRAVNGCPAGNGALGHASNGTPVIGPVCP